MIEDKYNVIGVMSGTSLDGIDLVHVEFKFHNNWRFKILHSETIPYDSFWRDRLKGLVNRSFEDLDVIDEEYTRLLAKTINRFITNNSIDTLDMVCSHGHTALHKPEEGLTYQIGNKPTLATLLNKKVVCDFRVQDVALGGQGAPLVPIGDKLLFPKYDICLNLGGFANLSTDIDGDRIAYDVCPVNIVLNHYVNFLGSAYDNEGQLASKGTLNEELLSELNALDFYAQSYPKSLGLEWVKDTVFPLIDVFQLETVDILHTFCEHIAIQIAKSIDSSEKKPVLVTGGGAYNTYLLNRIKFHSINNIFIPENTIVEFKEALIFAFLGVLKIRNEVNCLRSVTGAMRDHSSGVVF